MANFPALGLGSKMELDIVDERLKMPVFGMAFEFNKPERI